MVWLSIKPEHLQLDANRLDCLYWQRVLDKHPILKKKFPRKTDRTIGNDLFRMLYAWEPELCDEPSDIALATWISERLDTPAIKELRRRTTGNQSVAAFAAIKMQQELLRRRESNFKAITEIHEQIEAIKSIDSDSEQLQDSIDKIEQIQQVIAEQIKTEDKLANADSQAITQADVDSQNKGLTENFQIENAAKNVLNDLDGVDELVNLTKPTNEYSLEDGQDRYLDYGLDDNLMNSIRSQEDFRRIMQAVGRLRIMTGEIKSKKPLPTPTPVSITHGNSIADLVPAELALLDDPDLENLFLVRYVDNSLTQYDHRKPDKIGRGPIICLLDVSGSMAGVRMQNAKALCLTMMRTAIEQGRKCALIPFATYAGETMFFKDLESILGLVNLRQGYQSRLGGGTDFNNPLRISIDVLKDDMPKADVIMLTDGYSRVSEVVAKKVQQSKQDSEARFIGVNFAGAWQDDMKDLLDASIVVDDRGQLEFEWCTKVLELVV